MSAYAKRISVLSAKIFGEVSTHTDHKSMKVVKMFAERPLDKRFHVMEYYPNHPTIKIAFGTLRHFGLHRDEHEDFKQEIKMRKIERGLGKPKKGQGKRALKRQAKKS